MNMTKNSSDSCSKSRSKLVTNIILALCVSMAWWLQIEMEDRFDQTLSPLESSSGDMTSMRLEMQGQKDRRLGIDQCLSKFFLQSTSWKRHSQLRPEAWMDDESIPARIHVNYSE